VRCRVASVNGKRKCTLAGCGPPLNQIQLLKPFRHAVVRAPGRVRRLFLIQKQRQIHFAPRCALAGDLLFTSA